MPSLDQFNQLGQAYLPGLLGIRILRLTAGEASVLLVPKVTGSEDFSFYQRLVPGLFYFVGVTPPGVDPAQAASNHSPRFFVDEAGLLLGVRSLAHLAVDWLEANAPLKP